MDSRLLILAVLLSIGACLFGISFAARRRAPIEKGRVPVYEQMCSGRVGWFMGANYPAIRFSLYDTFLVVGFFRPIAIRFEEIVRAEIRREFLSRRLLIESRNAPTIRLSLREPEHVLELLRRK